MSRAIGVFDSGVGGLTVLRELQRALPQESTIYLGDSARVPYGGRPAETVRQFTLECLGYLYNQGVKALVIACNSATAAALEAARETFPVPVVGVIEATAGTAALSGRSRLGVLGTEITVASGEYPRAIRRRNPGLAVLQQACPRLADRVEAGEFDAPRTRMMLEGYLRPLLEQGIDSLVLGCTHYGFLRPLIRELVGPQVDLVECGPSVVADLARMMEEGSVERGEESSPTHRLLTTGDSAAFQRVASYLWPEGLPEIERVAVGVGDGALRGQAA